MKMNLKFKELKKYISSIDRLSICIRDNLRYENYRYVREVPNKYDELFVYGIGIIESEFKIKDPGDMVDIKLQDRHASFYFTKCIEIILSEKPRDEFFFECTNDGGKKNDE
ncbi:MAG: hypothetical protein SO023_00460 [Eubacterium sp.]|nr:hypothetical protein [Eubacterium sp.]